MDGDVGGRRGALVPDYCNERSADAEAPPMLWSEANTALHII